MGAPLAGERIGSVATSSTAAGLSSGPDTRHNPRYILIPISNQLFPLKTFTNLFLSVLHSDN